MKNVLLILFFINFYTCFSQEVFDVALTDKSKLIVDDIYQFHLKNSKWDIENYIYTLDLKKMQIDSLTFVNLINKAIEQKKTEKWTNEDLKNIYLIKKGELIPTKQVLSELDIKDKKETKTIKKQISQFNNRPNEWRSWPISISKPVFSNDNQYCIIGFSFGNNGGHTELYKKSESEWKRIGVFDRFAY
ncbi:hypothetical protein ACS386_09265 [Flavobacteriaceae bacterium LMO-SS05]